MSTMIRSLLKALPAAMLLCIGSQAFANDDEGQYVGYFRTGAGASSGGGPANCYYLGNGNGHGYRLGNECDSYAELGYAKTLATSPNGVKWVGKIMVADYSPNSLYNGNIGISQIYMQGNGFEELNGGNVWVGERYYERPDIHWMDMQYINLNGQGAGVDNIGTSTGGKFSYAIFKDGDTNNFAAQNGGPTTYTGSNSAIRNNFLLRGLPTNPGGKLDLIAGIITASGGGTDSGSRHNGFNLHLFHSQDAFGGGNTFAVQYGVGPGTGRGDPVAVNAGNLAAYQASPQATALNGPNGVCCNRMGVAGSTLLSSDDTRLRVFDALWIQPTKEFSAGIDVVYQADKLSSLYGAAQGTVTWTSFGIRPEYSFSQNFKIQGQLAYDHVSYPGAASQNLSSITIAPTLSFGPGFWDRPELRVFLTHANWNDAARATIEANNNASGGHTLGMGTAGTTVGVQAEIWWNEDWW